MSYGINAPMGFIPRRYLNDSPWSGGGIIEYQILPGYATSIFTGDAVVIANGYIQQATAASTQILGIFQGCQYQVNPGQGVAGTIVNASCWIAGTTIAPNTTITAYVIVDSNVMFDVQCTNSPGFTQSNIGTLYELTVGTGNTITGQSGMSLSQTTNATAGLNQFQVVNIVPISGNAWSTAATPLGYNNVYVVMNQSLFL